jgi:ech hydrogenase subunit F
MFNMTKNVVTNLLTKSSTRLYPIAVRGHFEGFRGTLVCNVDECIFCRTCMIKCPSQCITVDNKAGTWICDAMACVYCGVCVDVCPTSCLSMTKEHRPVATERQTISLQGVPKKKKKEEAAAE